MIIHGKNYCEKKQVVLKEALIKMFLQYLGLYSVILLMIKLQKKGGLVAIGKVMFIRGKKQVTASSKLSIRKYPLFCSKFQSSTYKHNFDLFLIEILKQNLTDQGFKICATN